MFRWQMTKHAKEHGSKSVCAIFPVWIFNAIVEPATAHVLTIAAIPSVLNLRKKFHCHLVSATVLTSASAFSYLFQTHNNHLNSMNEQDPPNFAVHGWDEPQTPHYAA